MSEEQQGHLDINAIMGLLPHRYPFLLVDRVVSYTPMETITAFKNVTINEPFFQGHFPGYPVMPGVLIQEALAQVGGILVLKSIPDFSKDKLFFFAGIEKARFKKPVVPGDQMMITVNYLNHKMNIWKMEGKVTVDGTVVAHGVVSAAIVDKEG